MQAGTGKRTRIATDYAACVSRLFHTGELGYSEQFMAPRRNRAGLRPMPDLASLITRRHDALRAHVGAAHNGKVEGVHQARVASRRLREVVPVLGTGLSEVDADKLGKDLRRLTRALGPVRELDVAAGMIEDLPLERHIEFAVPVKWRRYQRRIADIEKLLFGLVSLDQLKPFDVRK